MSTETYGVVRLPFGPVGIRVRAGRLVALDFLPPGARERSADDALVREVAGQLAAYCRDPHHRFDVPWEFAPDLGVTPFRRRVWTALMEIEVGRTETYGRLARRLGSSPRAVGQACGANPLPILVPCHRVVGARLIGGFMHADRGPALGIKRWLLAHEGACG